MTKIDILTLKLIVPDDYQQFWVRFEWFLALFIFLMKNGYWKSMQKWYFLVSKQIFRYFYFPTLPMQKIRSKWSFTRGALKAQQFNMMSFLEASTCRVNLISLVCLKVKWARTDLKVTCHPTPPFHQKTFFGSEWKVWQK